MSQGFKSSGPRETSCRENWWTFCAKQNQTLTQRNNHLSLAAWLMLSFKMGVTSAVNKVGSLFQS